nr:hypothetical protein [uncultured Pedobacter sp.]
MGKGFFIFWKLFALFYAIPFPMILYYNIKSDSYPPDLAARNPWVAIGLVVLSIIIWIIVLAGYYHKWILQTLSIKRKIEQLKNNGVKREAKILTSVDKSNPKVSYSTYELNLSFKNLVGAQIEERLTVNDLRSYERRFQEGKSVELVIDQNPSDYPYIVLSSFEVSIKMKLFIMLHIAWIIVAALITGYYCFTYQTESEGMGWRFMAFYHPLLVCALLLLFGNISILGRLMSKFANQNPKKDFLIKYKGLPATARLLKATQTGTYINEQPMVEFVLEFTDHQNQRYAVSIKKILDLLDLDSTRQKEVAIFYLKEDPRQVAFASDINELSISI